MINVSVVKNAEEYGVRNKAIVISFDITATKENLEALNSLSDLKFKAKESGTISLHLPSYGAKSYKDTTITALKLANDSGKNLKFDVERIFCKE